MPRLSRLLPWAVTATLALGFAAALTLRSAAAGDGDKPAPKEGPTGQVFQTIQYVMTAKWDKSKPPTEQPDFEQHKAFMMDHFAKGNVLMGGPYADMAGAQVVLNVSAEDAKKIATEDPFVKNGLLTATVKPWMVFFSHASFDVKLVDAPAAAHPMPEKPAGGGGSSCGAGK